MRRRRGEWPRPTSTVAARCWEGGPACLPVTPRFLPARRTSGSHCAGILCSGSCFGWCTPPTTQHFPALWLDPSCQHPSRRLHTSHPTPLVRSPQVGTERQQHLRHRAVAAIEPWLDRFDAVVVGPGLGRNPLILATVADVVRSIRQRGIPIVVDADGLWLINQDLRLVQGEGRPAGWVAGSVGWCGWLCFHRLIAFQVHGARRAHEAVGWWMVQMGSAPQPPASAGRPAGARQAGAGRSRAERFAKTPSQGPVLLPACLPTCLPACLPAPRHATAGTVGLTLSPPPSPRAHLMQATATPSSLPTWWSSSGWLTSWGSTPAATQRCRRWQEGWGAP